MSEKKPVPVLGRLAVQLKMITPDQLTIALHDQKPGSEKRLGEILVEHQFINEAQLAKLSGIQRDLVAKHRAKQAALAKQGDDPAPDGSVARKAPTEGPKPVVEAAAPRPTAKATPSSQPATATASAAPMEIEPEEPGTRVFAEDSGEDALDLSIAAASDAHAERLRQLLADAVQSRASDVHVHAGATPKQRVDGELVEMSPTPLRSEEAERLVSAALTPEQRLQLVTTGELDFCLELPGVGRFRANAYRQQRGFDAVFRTISPKPPTLEELGLPSDLARFTEYHQGMVLITGPAGCGKSATLAALVDRINEEREEHILTVEDPIEIVHPSKKCLVNQRHAGKHTGSFARALRGALREDPDIIVIGELRDLETISLAMTAAESTLR